MRFLIFALTYFQTAFSGNFYRVGYHVTSLYSSDYKLVILRRRINVKMIISSFYNKGGVNKLLILQFNAYLNRNLTSNCGLNLKQMPPTHPSMPRAVDFTPSRLSSPRFSHSKPANHYQTNSLYNYSKQVARSQVYMRARGLKNHGHARSADLYIT